MQHVHLESADQVDKKPYPASRDGVSTRNAVGVALDSEMHDAATTTTQAVTHPSSDLVLEVHQLPSPPHNIGTASHPTTTSSASSSSLLPAPSLQLSHDDAASTPGTGQQEQAGVTVAVHDSTELDCVVALDVDAKGNGNGRNSAVSAVLPKSPSLLPCATSPSQPAHSSTSPAIPPEANIQSPSSGSPSNIHSTLNTISSTQQEIHTPPSNPPENLPDGEMPFGIGGRRRSSGAENNTPKKMVSDGQLARNLANTNAVTHYEAGLKSKDRAVQREATRRYLADRIRSDWTWPPVAQPSQSPNAAIPQDSENQNREEQPTESLRDAIDTSRVRSWQERDDWSYSDDSDGIVEPDAQPVFYTDEKTAEPADATALNISITKDRRRRRQERMIKTKAEMSWNVGLRCFNERRDAWTGARTIKHPVDTAKPRAGEIEEMRLSSSSKDGDSSTAGDESEWEDSEIPIVEPILPADNPIRAHITHAAYNTIYDKVVTQAMTPSIPINLKDVVGSCVQGWKRDGQWENKASLVPGNLRKRTGTFSSMLGLKAEPPQHPNILDGKKDPGTQTGAFKRGYAKLFRKGRSASGSTI